METTLLRQFDRVSSISHKMIERLQSKDVPAEKCVYFPNWVDTDEIRPMDETSEYRAFFGLGADDVVVLYSGSISTKQGLELILESAKQLSQRPNVKFVICGEGPAKQKLVEEARGLTNVHFIPLQPGESLNQLLNLADIHILPQKPGAIDLVMPSKLLGMLASGKPVIAGCTPGSEVHGIVSEVGETFDPENSFALTGTILELAENFDRRRVLGAKSRRYACEHFSREDVIDKFIIEAENVVRIHG